MRDGSRPEIYGRVGWNALVQLSSQATPESVRLEFESRIILAGEHVTGAELIRARGINRSADAFSLRRIHYDQPETDEPEPGARTIPRSAE